MQIIWTEYFKYKAGLRGFKLSTIESIVSTSTERYFDTVTRRSVVIGRHDSRLVIIPYDTDTNEITPVTIHVTTRQQINLRIKAGRFIHE
jgi:hypothetical protein